MYELSRISLMNWNLIEIEDIEIRGTTALIGAVGVGKSTILDAIQTVHNGNQKSKLLLNRAAGVIKSKRTVLDYCLGVTEDTERLGLVRKACHTMIVLSYRDHKLKSDCSIGIVLFADGDQTREETRIRFVAQGVSFSFEEFADRDEDGNLTVESPDLILEKVRKIAGKGYKTHNSTALDFVESYLRAMRPTGGAPNANKFLKRFRNAIAFEEIADPTEFVRNFILDEDPIDTESLRTNLATWDEIAQTIENIEKKIVSAKAVRTRYIRHFENEVDKNEAKYQIAWSKEKNLSLEIEGKEGDIKGISGDITDISLEVATSRSRIEREEADLDRKKDQERASGYSEGQALLNSKISLQEERFAGAAKSLDQTISVAHRLKSTESLSQYLPNYVKPARAKVDDLVEIMKEMSSGGNFLTSSRTLNEVLAEIKSAGRASEALEANLDTEIKKRIELEDELNDDKASLKSTQKGGAILGHHTRSFIARLLNEEIVGKALPTLVSVQPGMERWVRAAEATLGAFREAIFVPGDQFAEAANLLRSARVGGAQDLWNVRLVNTSRIERGKGLRHAQENAVVSTLNTDDDNVRKFLDSQFGKVEMVDTIEELREHSSGIMEDCTQSQALAVRVHKKRDPILGQVAQDSLRHSLSFKINDLEANVRRQEIQIRSLKGGVSIFEALSKINTDEVSTMLASMESLTEEISSLKERRDAEITPEAKNLKEEIQAHVKNIKTLRKQVDEELTARNTGLERKKARLEAEVTTLKVKRGVLNVEMDHLIEQDREEYYETYRKALRIMEHPAQDRRISSIAHRLNNNDDQDIDWYRDFVRKAEIKLTEACRVEDHIVRRLRQISPFLEQYDEDRSIAEMSAEKIMTWVSALVFNLTDNELLKHSGRVQEFRDNTRREVKEILVVKLYDSLQRALSELKKLNRRLKHHRFEGMTYYFDWKIDGSMRSLYEMARRVALEPEKAASLLSDGGDAALDEAVDTIRDIFANEGDVSRFEDYRQYFRYEIRMTHDEVTDADIDTQDVEGMRSQVTSSGSLSDRVAKGSGGQKQTPYYVAIAASMAAAYYPNSRAGESMGMGLVCFDEAFSKLDVKNTQELIRFFKELNLQILVAAPEEKRTSFMELMDTIVNISKIPGEPELFLDVEHIGERARNELKRLNPERIGLDGYRKIIRETEEQSTMKASY